MTDSILNSTKKALGIAADYDQFDPDIIMLINTTFSTLHQLGIGPNGGFSIEDDTTTWTELLEGDDRFNSVKTLVHLKVRLIFDPPTTSFTQTAFQEQVKELEWRLNVARENQVYGQQLTDVIILDGGDP